MENRSFRHNFCARSVLYLRNNLEVPLLLLALCCAAQCGDNALLILTCKALGHRYDENKLNGLIHRLIYDGIDLYARKQVRLIATHTVTTAMTFRTGL